MNERIEQLATQAGVESNFNGYNAWYNEKFAELIVRECAESASYYGNRVRQHVLKHFGVEE